jgi:hypothetical protein
MKEKCPMHHGKVAAAVLCGVLLWMGDIVPAAAQDAAWTDRIRFSGDYRVRHEGFYNQKNASGAGLPSRNRIRVRGRVGLAATVNPYTTFTLRLATGNPEDPISTNETLDDFFKRPEMNLDRGFVRLAYTSSSRPVTVSAEVGKIPNPAYSVSQLVWDADLNPSGITEKLTVKGGGAFKQFDVQLMQFAVDETGAGKDTWMFGGQAKLVVAPGRGVEAAVGLGDYVYFQPDAIAHAASSAVVKGNRTDANGDFISDFHLINITGEVTLQTGAPAYPVSLFADYAVNAGAKADTTGSREHTGLYAGIKIGKAGKPGEVSIAGTFLKTRQDAVLSTFGFSDVPADGRQGALVEISIPVLPRTAVNLTGIFTRPINAVGAARATLVRTQLDLVVQF